MLAIETRALCKTYGQRRVVDNFTMHVPEGAIYGFVGKNGAGKSTVMKMIDSLVTPTSGEILLYENVVNGTAESGVRSNRRIGALIEDPGLYPALTATENLMCKALAIGFAECKSAVRRNIAYGRPRVCCQDKGKEILPWHETAPGGWACASRFAGSIAFGRTLQWPGP